MIYNYKDIKIRAIEECDLVMLREMINDQETENMTGGWSFPISEYQHKKWFEGLSQNVKDLRVIIDTQAHGPIGLAVLTDIDWKNRTAQFHVKISTNPDLRGKGFGTKATRALASYAFNQMNLRLLYSDVLEYNAASRRMFEKSGFLEEGLLRNRIYKNGEYHNVVIYSIQKGELVE